jgi:hypothetical protein
LNPLSVSPKGEKKIRSFPRGGSPVPIAMYFFTIHVTNIGHFILVLPPFNFPQGGNGKPLLSPWGKVGKGVTENKKIT